MKHVLLPSVDRVVLINKLLDFLAKNRRIKIDLTGNFALVVGIADSN